MATWQQVDVDAKGNGLFMAADAEGNLMCKTVENCQPILDANKNSLTDNGKGKGDMRHRARIPASIWLEWWQEFGGNPMAPENRLKLERKLNDPDLAYLRTTKGRISGTK